MSEAVLDASAILALLNAEEGAGLVLELLPQSVISAVNMAEVVTRLSAAGMPENEVRETLLLLGMEIVPFDEEQALQAGLLHPQTAPIGLSLGDRACLALAKRTAATAVTADRVWEDLHLELDIKMIR